MDIETVSSEATESQGADVEPSLRRETFITDGVPIVLGEFGTWTLPYALTQPSIDDLRDAIFDRYILKEQVIVGDISLAACRLLRVNYDISPEDAGLVLRSAVQADLAEAVWACLIGETSNHRTYSQWVRSSLYTAGLDPAKIPPRELGHVLRHLEMSGRVEPKQTFISSVEAKIIRGSLPGG